MGENRSEKATPRRRQKAREQGRVARSRDLPSSLALCAVIGVLSWLVPRGFAEWKSVFRILLQQSSGSFPLERGFAAVNQIGQYWAYPALGAALLAAGVSSVAQGGIVFAPSLLKPDFSRINPLSRLKQIFSWATAGALGKSLIPTSIISYLVVGTLTRDWALLSGSAQLSARPIASLMSSRLFEAAWKSALVLSCWSALDLLLERQRFEQSLRMTHQEIREEVKESEGNPQVKARIRKLQRQVRRKRMLQDVAKATVVITNPTEYAIALEYNETLLAPVVVAKGRSLLAQQIKQAARWNGIPTVENVPLAHALYRAAEVGQAIPAKLYAAVAEVLAFIMRAQARVAEGRA